MTRVKGGPRARRRHKEVITLMKGQWGSRHKLFRRAHESLLHSWQYAYEHRRERKGDMRRLWITRINAAARLNGLTVRATHSRPQAGRSDHRSQDHG